MKRTHLVLAAGFFALLYISLHTQDSAIFTKIPAQPEIPKVQAMPHIARSVVTPIKRSSSADELRALHNMTHLFAQFSQPGAELGDLVESLKSSGQDPIVARDINPYTGEMDVVHTQNPSEGTRYFLGQFFVDERGQRFAQHLSFEFKPGPTAVPEALAALKEAFPNLGEPTFKRGDDFSEWDVGNGYVVWVQRLSQEDVRQEDPDNVYTDADVGALKVALEINPHTQEN